MTPPNPQSPTPEEIPWIACASKLPADKVEVETKIEDSTGVRNVQSLKRSGRLWFFPDMSVYVYCEPTHWRPLTTCQHGNE